MSALYLPERGIVMGWTPLAGEGPPVLCLPGIGCVASYLATAFSEAPLRGREALLVDLPGAGMTESLPGRHDLPGLAGAVAEFMDVMGLSDLPVFGHSLGGSVAIELARQRSDLVSRLVVAEANATPGGGVASRAMSQGRKEDFVAEGFAKRLASLRAAAIKGDAIAALLYAGRKDVDPGALFETARGLVDLDPGLADAFCEMTIPRAFIYGERGFPSSADAATPDTPDPTRLEAAGIATEVVPGGGHFMVVENSLGTAEAIARHIK